MTKSIRFHLSFYFLVPLALSFGTTSASAGIVVPDDDSLYVSEERMEEWNDWRFGMFIHWGPWAQTEIGYIWYMVNDELPEEAVKRFDLYKTFNPVKFDPAKWARAAKAAGMKYVVFVTKHHDGMNNWDTQLSDFKTTAPVVPYHDNPNADLTRAVVEAFRAEGIKIGLYYSHIDWHHPDGKYFSQRHWDYDPNRIDTDPDSWRRFVNYQTGQLRELLTQYGEVDVIWFDIRWPHAVIGTERIEHPVVRKDVLDMLRMMKELQPNIIFNERGTDLYGAFYTPEQQIPEIGLPGNWESSITITNRRGYWYKGENVSAKSVPELVHMLIDIASKGGNFLMNVGPRPDGELSQTEYDALEGVGDWMDLYSESIYGTRKSLFHHLPWGKSTTKGKTLYFHVYDWPKDGKLRIPGLKNEIKKAYLLCDNDQTPLKTEASGEDKLLTIGMEKTNPIASVVVVKIQGDPDIHNFYRQVDDSPLYLSSGYAEIKSDTASYEFGKNIRKGNFIRGMENPGDSVQWEFQLNAPGLYRVRIEYSVQEDQAGSRFSVNVPGAAKFYATTKGTAIWEGDLLDVPGNMGTAGQTRDNTWTFQSFDVGAVQFEEAGEKRISLTAESIAHNYLMYLKSVTLVPVED